MEASIFTTQAQEEAARTVENFTIVERVARIASSVRGTRPDYTRLASELEQAIPFDIFGVVLLRHDRQAVRVTVCYRERNDTIPVSEDGEETPVFSLLEATAHEQQSAWQWKAAHHQHPLEGSMLASLLKTPVLTQKEYASGLDGLPAECGDALSNYPQLRSTVIAPLIVEERVLGTLELGSTLPQTYADTSLQRFIEAVSRVLATAIESTQQGGSAEIQNRQRQALKDVSSALTSKVDLSSILAQIVHGVTQALNVASAIITVDSREGKFRLEAQAGLHTTLFSTILSAIVATTDDCIVSYTFRHRQPCTSADISVDERFPMSVSLYQQLGIRSVYCYPLMTGTVVYGVLVLCSQEAGGFTPLKVDILSLFASQATIAIHNSLLLRSIHQRRRFQEAIEQLEHTTHAQNDASGAQEHEVLARVREETQQTFGISFTTLLDFVSQHLLTRDERDLQTLFHHEDPYGTLTHRIQADELLSPPSFSAIAKEVQQIAHERPVIQEQGDDILTILTRTEESALVRAGMLGELGELLMQLRQSTNVAKDAWFVVDLHGSCVYMNAAAEAFCGIRLHDIEVGSILSGEIGLVTHHVSVPSSLLQNENLAAHMTIEQVFAELLPRIRNAEDVRVYMQEFSQASMHQHSLRCILAIEPIVAKKNERTAHKDAGRNRGERPQPWLLRTPGVQQTKHTAGSSVESALESVSSDYHYQLNSYALHNEQGQLVAHALQAHDITEQVRDEKNRLALLSSVSHDLRTPLTAIKTAVTGLLQTGVTWDEQDLHAMLEDVDAETDHLTDLVNELIEMQRIEMGALILEKAWCSCVEIVHGAIKKAEHVLAGRPVQTYFEPNLPLVYVDHVQLENVFYHLLKNAACYKTERKEITITLRMIQQEYGKTTPMLLCGRVIDYGCTIPEDEQADLFRSFHNLRSYGNGMGLAICKGIVEAHQGRIWVEKCSAPFDTSGVAQHESKKMLSGACFVFTLPVYPHRLAHRSERVGARQEQGVQTGVMSSSDEEQLIHTERAASVTSPNPYILEE